MMTQSPITGSAATAPGGRAHPGGSPAVLDSLPGAGLVLLSGHTAGTLDVKGIVSRGGIFLSKPVASDELLAAVARAAEQRSAPGFDGL